MKTRSKRSKIDIRDSDLEIPPLTDKQLKSMRRVTPEEHERFRKALENTFGRPFPSRLGRPPKSSEEKYRPVYIKLHPRVLSWARAQAKKRGIGYQTVINQTLLRHAA
jgi:uncharacterized protein (DUF4415 family)